MNLSNSPTKQQLKAVIAGSNDNEGHHVLWVERNGEVHLSLLPYGQTPVMFEQSLGSEMKFRLEALAAGMGLTGPAVARDEEEMTRLFDRIIGLWKSDFEGCSDASDDI